MTQHRTDPSIAIVRTLSDPTSQPPRPAGRAAYLHESAETRDVRHEEWRHGEALSRRARRSGVR